MKKYCFVMLAVSWSGSCSFGAPEAAHQLESAAAFSIAGSLYHDEALNEAHDVQLQGNLAFVPGKGGSLAVIDVAEPANPTLVWHRYEPEALPDSETVLIEQDRLFLGTLDFHSIDIRNPRAPRFEAVVAERPQVDRINGMVRIGGYIFAANKQGWVDAFDVSDARSPRLAAAHETRQQYDLNYPHDLDRLGDLVVMVDPNQFGVEGRLGQLAVLRVFDDAGNLADPADWELVGRLATSELRGANRVEVSGDFAYVGGSLTPAASLGKPSAKGVVIDLSDPTSPRQAAAVDFADIRGPNGLVLSGDVWFLAGGQTIEAYDITEPRAPRKLASFRSEEAFPTADDNAHDLVYRDGYLYVSSQGDNGLVVLRVDDPEIVRLAEKRR